MSAWQEDFAEWKRFAGENRARAARVRSSMVERARRLAAEAGLSSEAPFHYAHNASVSAHYGRPWSGVDYSAVRRLLWLEKRSWEPERIADRVNGRAYKRLMQKHAPEAPATRYLEETYH